MICLARLYAPRILPRRWGTQEKWSGDQGHFTVASTYCVHDLFPEKTLAVIPAKNGLFLPESDERVL
jgi:hypothetical protein